MGVVTRRDLVEAEAFGRRRLVAAFVAGVPGGREIEPTRPGRALVAGIALSVLLVTGAAVTGALADGAEVDWTRPGLVSDERGALYVVLDEDDAAGEPPLRPVVNVTSAQLVLGGDVRPQRVPADDLASRPQGPPIGIVDAPTAAPAADRLVGSGWTACTGSGLGVVTAVLGTPRVEPAPRAGFVVRGATSGRAHLIAEAAAPGRPVRAHRYRLPDDNDALHVALHVSPNDEVVVPDDWLRLFPAGGPLTVAGLGIGGWGDPVHGGDHPPGTRVGDWFEREGVPFAVTGDRVVELTPFAAAVLRNTPMGDRLPRQVADPATGYDIDPATPYLTSRWPREVLAGSTDATDQVCGVLETRTGQPPAVRLATAPSGAASAAGLAAGERDVEVEPGRGALVRPAGWDATTADSLHLVDDRGRLHPVAGEDELARLGWSDVEVPVVPQVWTDLFAIGPELSVEAALCPADGCPATQNGAGPRSDAVAGWRR